MHYYDGAITRYYLLLLLWLVLQLLLGNALQSLPSKTGSFGDGDGI
jgi:hypothetical protein